jgi:uncharacterized protein YkwD
MKKQKKASPKTRQHKSNVKSRILLGKARFLPALIITVVGSFLLLQPQAFTTKERAVLVYATNTTTSGLLAATNTQRSNNGIASLSQNSQLQTAAQAKANDMTNRNYWSHQTPEGEQPWIFIDAAGYEYLAAGENLAYGFLNSDSTVTGWMNSPPHKENLLSSTFQEVGFGIANSPNYVNSGEQTVVVAMYGKPYNQPVAPEETVLSSPPKTTTPPQPAVQTPTIDEVPPATTSEPETTTTQPEPITTSTTDEVVTVATPTKIQRVDLLDGSFGVLSVSVVIFAVLGVSVLWLVHKGFHIKKFITTGEQFLIHHVYLDITVLAIIFLGFVLLSTSGTVR